MCLAETARIQAETARILVPLLGLNLILVHECYLVIKIDVWTKSRVGSRSCTPYFKFSVVLLETTLPDVSVLLKMNFWWLDRDARSTEWCEPQISLTPKGK